MNIEPKEKFISMNIFEFVFIQPFLLLSDNFFLMYEEHLYKT